jgi:hypothetical protein
MNESARRLQLARQCRQSKYVDWRDDAASQNMFLNIFFVHPNSTAAAEQPCANASVGMRGPRCGWLRVKLVAPTSQAAALFYGRLFEVGQT